MVKSGRRVFGDAHLDLAADCIERDILPNGGKFCVAGSRILVEQSIASALAERLPERFARHPHADTLAAEAGFAPIISTKQMARIDGIVQAAAGRGARFSAAVRPSSARATTTSRR